MPSLAYRRIVLASLLIAFTPMGRGNHSVAAPPQKPNIVLIFADDIGYEALNCYGGLDFKTPRLNAMAAEGLRFTRAYTSPVCTPSRVSLHTSRYVSRHGHLGVLPVHLGTKQKVDFQRMPTFAQLMRRNGYLTSVTGKWQLATLEVWPNHIRDAGFDSWCIWQIWRNGKKTLRHWTPTLNEDGKVREEIADRFGPDVLADYVIEQMTEAKDAGKPFMIVHNELLPHDPIIETPDDRRLKRPARLGHMIHYMDKLVGRVLDAVERMGLRENTYVLFMGDNGTNERDFANPKASEPGERAHTRHTKAGQVNGGKRDLNDAGTHVPLIVWGPKAVPRGKVCEDLIDVVDLFPTFCALSNTPVPANVAIDGRSFARQMQGHEGKPRAWVHHGVGNNGESVFDGAFRLHRKTGRLIDARDLPAEKQAADGDAEANAARKRLTDILKAVPREGASGGKSTRGGKVNREAPAGAISVDDHDARRSEAWRVSRLTGTSFGPSYRHDGGAGDGKALATFSATLPKPGRYEVRASYTSHSNRATNVPVSIKHRDGEHHATLNQRKPPKIGGLFTSLGTFPFEEQGAVTISNKGTNGHVIIDGVVWVPVAE